MGARPVESNQEGIHPDLEALVRKHLEHPSRRPVATHTRLAFAEACAWLAGKASPLILDTGCGTGESSLWLARSHPNSLVIGVDKSLSRLDRGLAQALPSNLLLLRAELEDFWVLAAAAGWRLEEHYLLYPNPWPKKHHVMRRWHGHPVFPMILALGGRLVLRSNWRTYAQEFAQAWEIVAGRPGVVEEIHPESPVTAFERKYLAAAQPIWQFRGTQDQ